MISSSYDPLQLAERQSADFAASSRLSGSLSDPQQQAQLALKSLEWIEFAEESMIRAEDDCLVEYSEVMHRKLHELYETWLTTCQAVRTSEVFNACEADSLAALVAAEQRVREWLQVQADIVRHSLPHAELSEMARLANLSAGNRSPHAAP